MGHKYLQSKYLGLHSKGLRPLLMGDYNWAPPNYSLALLTAQGAERPVQIQLLNIGLRPMLRGYYKIALQLGCAQL